MLTVGERVDRYIVERLLGAGGTAQVWLVRHVDLGTRHALKVLQFSSSSVRSRVVLEGQIQARLAHRHIVPVTDVITVDGSPALLMPWIDGPTLETLIRHYPPTLHQVDALARGLLAGAAAAHALGSVHRDLKPSNVLIEISADDVIPRIADFGLARMLDESSGRHTRSGVAMGSLGYMAPEQIRSAAMVGKPADVFALGCILYELVTGMPPFLATDLVALHGAILARAWRPVRPCVPGVPVRMETAIGLALEPDPSARPQDAQALLDLWCGHPVATLPEPVWEAPHLQMLQALVVQHPGGTGTAGVPDLPGRAPAPVTPGGFSARDTGPVQAAPDDVELLPDMDLRPRPSVTVLLGTALASALVGFVLLGQAWSWSEVRPADQGAPADAAAALPSTPEPGQEVRPSPQVGIVSPVGEGSPPAPVLRAAASSRTPSPGKPAEPAAPATGLGAGPTAPSVEGPPPPAVQRSPGWSIEGAQRAWLVASDGRRYPPGPVPQGAYQLSVIFPGDVDTTEVLRLRIAAHGQVAITCDRTLRTCR